MSMIDDLKDKALVPVDTVFGGGITTFNGAKGGAISGQSINTGDISTFQNLRMEDGFVDVQDIIPLPMQAHINQMFQKAGLKNFNIGEFACVGGKDQTKNLAKIAQVAEIASRNAELIPKFKKQLAKILKAMEKQGEFQADVAKQSLATQFNLQKSHAGTLMEIMGFGGKNAQVQRRVALYAARVNEQDQANQALCTTQFGNAQKLIQTTLKNAQDRENAKLKRKQHVSNKGREKAVKREEWRMGAANAVYDV